MEHVQRPWGGKKAQRELPGKKGTEKGLKEVGEGREQGDGGLCSGISLPSPPTG